MTITMNERIEQYRLVYRYATDDGVRRTGLTNDIEKDQTILIERINAKAQKRDKYAPTVTLQMILDWYS